MAVAVARAVAAVVGATKPPHCSPHAASPGAIRSSVPLDPDMWAIVMVFEPAERRRRSSPGRGWPGDRATSSAPGGADLLGSPNPACVRRSPSMDLTGDETLAKAVREGVFTSGVLIVSEKHDGIPPQ